MGDLSRKKATGKGFRYKAIEVFEIDDEGLITKNDEYYSAWFDEGVDVRQYRKLPCQASCERLQRYGIIRCHCMTTEATKYAYSLTNPNYKYEDDNVYYE